LVQNEAELTKILEANKSGTGSDEGLHDSSFNLGIFNIKIRGGGDKKDDKDPEHKNKKSSACSIQ
jgi:hypothetical protein